MSYLEQTGEDVVKWNEFISKQPLSELVEKLFDVKHEILEWEAIKAQAVANMMGHPSYSVATNVGVKMESIAKANLELLEHKKDRLKTLIDFRVMHQQT